MEKYTGIYATSGDVQSALSAGTLHRPYMAIVQDGNYIDWNGDTGEPVYSAMPLTFQILTPGEVTFAKTRAYVESLTIEYNKNNTGWVSLTSEVYSAVTKIAVEAGDIVQFRGNNKRYNTGADSGNWQAFSGTATYNAYGNPNSLLSADNFQAITAYTNSYCLACIFKGSNGLISAENLALPTLSLSDNCYAAMFRGCSTLVTPPKLPATRLANRCYYCMFTQCSSLSSLPDLPATKLANACYQSMFDACVSITSVPADYLPVTSLTQGCYRAMFQKTTIIAGPDLPAAIVPDSAYKDLFRFCTRINYIKCLATTRAATSSTEDWVGSIRVSDGTFVKHPDATWTTGVNGIPEGWTVETATE